MFNETVVLQDVLDQKFLSELMQIEDITLYECLYRVVKQAGMAKSKVLKKLLKKMKPILDRQENSPYRQSIKNIILSIGFMKSFRKAQIYTYFYLYNSRGIHTLRVAILAVNKIAEHVRKNFGVEIDEGLLVAICLAHDAFHYPTGHPGEVAVKWFLGCSWNHNRQGVWMFSQVLNLVWDAKILDGVACHSCLFQSMRVDNEKFDNAVDIRTAADLGIWLINEGLPGFIEVMIAKLADKFSNAFNDIADARKMGVDVSVADDLLQKLGTTEKRVHDNLIRGIITDGKKVLIDTDIYENEVEVLQDISYKKTIHLDEELQRKRKGQRNLMAQILVASEYLISTGQFQPGRSLLDNMIKEHLDKLASRYSGIERLSFIKSPKIKIIAKDIFDLMDDYQLMEAANNVVYISDGDRVFTRRLREIDID